jgi:hypothetical protein
MANTLKLGAGNWATKESSLLAYNDENGNFKPLPFDFTRASSATRVNKQGLIETVGSNEPRIDYTDANGALLLEPTRTNVIINSEDFTGSEWGLFGFGSGTTPILTSNYATSPDGKQNATRLQFNINSGTTLSDRSYIRYTSFTSQTDYYYSCYVKSANGQEQKLLWQHGGDGYEFTVTNEWQRVELDRNGYAEIYTGFSLRGSISTVSSADVLIWGFQVEQGSYATSYIPTSGAAVTRVAESSSQTPVSGIIGQTEGTVFLDFKPQTLDATSRYLSVENSSSVSNGWMGIFAVSLSSNIKFRFYGDGWDFSSTLIIEKDKRYKIAFSYKNGVQTSVYINGNLIGNLTASLSGKSFQKIRLSEAPIGVRGDAEFKDLKLYNTALTDQELIALTS